MRGILSVLVLVLVLSTCISISIRFKIQDSRSKKLQLQPRENFASPPDTDTNELHELHTLVETLARHDHVSIAIAPSSIIKLIHHVLQIQVGTRKLIFQTVNTHI